MIIEMQEGPLKTKIGEFYDSKGIQIRRDQEYMIYYKDDKTTTYVLRSTNEVIYRLKKLNKEVYYLLKPTKNRDDYPKIKYATKKDLPFDSLFMTRHFAINKMEETPKIIEVEKPTRTNLFKFVKLEWQIGGSVEQAEIHNSKQLRVAEKKIPGISEVIPTLHLHQSKFEDDRNLGELLLQNPTYTNPTAPITEAQEPEEEPVMQQMAVQNNTEQIQNNPITQVNLDALPGQWIFQQSGEEYVGKYHLHQNGEAMINPGVLGVNHQLNPSEIIVRVNVSQAAPATPKINTQQSPLTGAQQGSMTISNNDTGGY